MLGSFPLFASFQNHELVPFQSWFFKRNQVLLLLICGGGYVFSTWILTQLLCFYLLLSLFSFPRVPSLARCAHSGWLPSPLTWPKSLLHVSFGKIG